MSISSFIQSKRRDPKLKLLEHQINAVKWAKNREASTHHGVRGGIAFMEMGLGKTPVGLTTAFMTNAKHDDDPDPEPTTNEQLNLVVVPKPLLAVWKQHAEDWFPDRRVIIFHKEFIGEKRFNELSYEEVKGVHMLVTTYDVVVGADRKYQESEAVCIKGEGMFKDKIIEVVCRRSLIEDSSAKGDRLLYKIKWDRIITDESHKFANYTTKTYKAVMALYGSCRWAMTGTVIRNKESDLWSLLRFIGYNRISSGKKWSERCYKRDHLDCVILKMNYSDTNIKLPERHDHNISYGFSEKEQIAYDIVKKKVIAAYNGMISGDVQFMHVLALFTRLRQMCIAPHLITPESKRKYRPSDSPQDDKADIELEDATKGLVGWIHDASGTSGVLSSKLNKMVEIVDSIDTADKVIIASSFTSALDLASEALELSLQKKGNSEGYYSVMIDGDTKNRDSVINCFKTDAKCRFLFMSFKVGGEGHTLIGANHVIQLDPWWTGAVLDQLASRVHRFGQAKECHVWCLFAEESIETNMVMAIVNAKREINTKFFGGASGGTTIGKATSLDKNMMGNILMGRA